MDQFLLALLRVCFNLGNTIVGKCNKRKIRKRLNLEETYE
jgi:hypothetical protein